MAQVLSNRAALPVMVKTVLSPSPRTAMWAPSLAVQMNHAHPKHSALPPRAILQAKTCSWRRPIPLACCQAIWVLISSVWGFSPHGRIRTVSARTALWTSCLVALLPPSMTMAPSASRSGPMVQGAQRLWLNCPLLILQPVLIWVMVWNENFASHTVSTCFCVLVFASLYGKFTSISGCPLWSPSCGPYRR